MEPIIEFEKFTFKYRSQVNPTLFDIDLKIYPGEKVLIVGPSGSGKSTLADCINGLIPFSYPGESTGTLKIGGKDPKKLGIFGLSKMVGTVLQDTDGQFIGLTVAEDIAFVLENDRMEQQEMFRRVNEVADTVEVRPLLSHAPSELSGGQKQRVSMAGVMIDDVDILLFDEPLANLDPATGKKAIGLIDRIQKEKNKTILIIEHRLEDALYKDVDRIVVIGDGRIVADMKPDALLSGDTLKEQGIREPLYITALKHAGCAIREEYRPSHVETMDFEPYKTKVKEWFETTETKKRAAEEKPVLKVDHLNFSYQPGKPILSDVSFTVNKGEMLSIVGKNGAGKTTLSGLICGFLTLESGSIELNGEDISPLSIKERGEKIGIVMQNPNQMISKPMIFDEVALGLAVRGVPEDEIEDMAENSANTVPVMMPYIDAFFMPRAYGDRPNVVPDGSANFAFLGQFAETPRDTIFTTEYSMRTGMEAVYTLLNVDRGVPEVWGSVYDVRDLLNATVKLRDGKKATDMELGLMEKLAVKKLLGKIENTDIEKLLKEYHVI